MLKIFLLPALCYLFQTNLVAQEKNTDNVPAKNTSLLPLPKGPSVFGVFDGRTPCQEIAKELNQETVPECIKIKWRLVLYQDSKSHAPTNYTLEGFVYKNPVRGGKWRIIRGTNKDPKAIVYQLDPDKPAQSVYFYKGDDNVLFFLDKNKHFMAGNRDFSYTLNRTGE